MKAASRFGAFVVGGDGVGIVTPRTATGSSGLRAIELTGGVEHAVFGLKPGHGYPPAPGARIAKTYAQLSGDPRTGGELYRELKAED